MPDDDKPSVRSVIGLPPEDTLRAWDARGDLATTVRWAEMWQEEHARAFTVAKVARLDLLETIRASIDDAARNGATFEMWKERLQPELEKAGWWGRVKDRSLTGTDAAVMVGPRRLKTIFTTNMRVSRAASQWARIQRYKGVRPFLRYVTVGDHKVRWQHREWHGVILPVDHPWWQQHFPPNGWNCRCTVQQLDQATMDRRGWKVSPGPPPETPPRRFYRPGTKESVLVPGGFDPGWAYNPGMASLRAVGDKAASSIDAAWKAGNPAAARETLAELVESRAFDSIVQSYQRLGTDGAPIGREDAERTSFPILAIDDEVRHAIGANTAIARLSADTVAKQFGKRDEIGVDEYRMAARIAEAPEHRYSDKPRHAVLLGRDGEGRWLHVVVKATGSGEGLFVQSVRIAPKDKVAVALARWPAIGSILGALLMPGEDEEDDDAG